MYMLFQRFLGNGKTYVHIEADWDVLKWNLVRDAKRIDISIKQFDDTYAWELLRNGNVVADGSYLWWLLDSSTYNSENPIFTGTVIFLQDVENEMRDVNKGADEKA